MVVKGSGAIAADGGGLAGALIGWAAFRVILSSLVCVKVWLVCMRLVVVLDLL